MAKESEISAIWWASWLGQSLNYYTQHYHTLCNFFCKRIWV